MNTKNPFRMTVVLSTLLAVLAVQTIAAWWFACVWFFVSLILLLGCVAGTVAYWLKAKVAFREYLSHIAAQLDTADREALARFPLPVAVGTAAGAVLWYNDVFRTEVLGGEEAYGATLAEMTGGYTTAELGKKRMVDVTYNEKKYSVYVSRLPDNGDICLYYVDNTRLKGIAEEYTASRPVVLSVFIDNLEELSVEVRDSERAQLAGKVQTLLEEWLGRGAGLLQKYDSDRFLIITENRRLEEMIKERFSILDTVRNMSDGVHKTVTLSIGVGQDTTVAAAAVKAAQSLEMALGRGGDQAAIKTKNGFDFYGGVSKGVERRTKVRTRMIASALNKLIASSNKVLLVGHAFSDMDSIGSAAALALHIRNKGKTAYVVADKEQSLAKELIQYIEKQESNLFLQPQDAEVLVDAGTLVIVTDTHIPDRVDGKLLKNAKMVAVIDHHRRMVGGIENPTLFYHEPTASSAAEMVAELLQYMGDPTPQKTAAEALLAGIILDTRNFVLRAGARTFEAAAYLRRLGADTVKVQELFAADMELYRRKAALVSDAVIYKDIAIAVGSGNGAAARIAASQAANELLTIRGVKASFTLMKIEQGVNISARSMGDINVQLITETLGGGGHLTMAGALLKNTDTDTAVAQVKAAVDAYLSQLK
ncbi:MAG: DHH family phosphoesterase [Clostridia bacterium]|nr:DHH family phosphoesterase [Clostridia bacterium]